MPLDTDLGPRSGNVTSMARATSSKRRKRVVFVGTTNIGSYQSFPFLDLPAELRNLVYEFIIHHIPDDNVAGSVSARLKDMSIPKLRSGLAIAQTCKQLRLEFRHLYFARVTKWVPLRWIDLYLATFHSSNDSVEDDVTIDLLELTSGMNMDYNMLVLCKDLSHLPNVPAVFDHAVYPGRGRSLIGLGSIFTRCAFQARTVKWKVAAAKVSSITLAIDWRKKVVVKVKNGFRLPEKKLRKTFEEGLKKDLGLKGEESWEIQVKYSD